MSADAVAVLKDDHRSVEAIFRRFEAAGPRAYATKRKLVDRFIRELSIHAAIEEQVFYPAVRQAVGHTEEQVLESLEEHHLVKITLRELETLEPKDERFDPKVRVLIESVRHHVKEEERDLFPRVRRALRSARLRELGQQLLEAKSIVPDRPHPGAPDEPPTGPIADAGALLLDSAKDAATKVVRRLAT